MDPGSNTRNRIIEQGEKITSLRQMMEGHSGQDAASKLVQGATLFPKVSMDRS